MADAMDFLEQMNALRQSYAERLPDRIIEIEDCWQALLGQWDSGMLQELHRNVHNITGSGAVYGFTRLSEAARPLDIFLASIIESASIPTEAQRAQFEVLFAILKEAAINPDEQPPQTEDSENLILAASGRAGGDEMNNGLIYIASTDVGLIHDLDLQISHFSYQVQAFGSIYEMREAVTGKLPAAIILDVDSFSADLTTLPLIAQIKQSGSSPIPLVFISTSEDIMTRLQAVRAGGDAFFTRPVDIGALIDKLDVLTAHQNQDPYHVLIVDDEQPLADYYALTLQQAGIITSTINNPLQVLQALIEFRPDLILMDVYMPVCNGLEMATVIRQQEDFVSIPIVFLSAETDFHKQMLAMSRGGDDFLTKPIKPAHLVAAVTSRAQRSRVLRSLMVRDSLTGLLNHTATKEHLDIEMARAQRNNAPLAFVMLDIDHFKSVNDTHGHAAGDRVIKSLSRLLQQRLRKTDIVGRYGGEEFAAILVDTDGPTAVHVMDEVRSHFQQIRHQGETEAFSVTFSCGVAASPLRRTSADLADAEDLADAADKALYEAKRSGRNRVIMSDSTLAS